jgi:DNA primase
MKNWLDFAAIKSSVSLAVLLRHYQVRLHRSGRDQYRGPCPIHRGEGREAFHANLTRNIFHCFSCGAGGTVLDFVAAMEACSLTEAAHKLALFATVDAVTVAAPQKPLVTKKSKVPVPLGFTLRGIDSRHPYLAARGIEIATAQQFGIGFYRGPGSSVAGWSFPSIMSAENWSPTVAVRWMGISRATDSLADSPNRRSCSTSTAPPRQGNKPPLW